MATAVIVVLTFLTYGNPILVVWILVRRLVKKQADEPKWRVFVLWVALLLAAAAVIGFWAAVLHGPLTTTQDDAVFRGFLRASILMAAVALLLAIVGKGKGRVWIVLSALITPLSWLWALLMQ